MSTGALAHLLRQHSLRRVRTTANGNCLFNSISIVLYGSQKYHKVMRREAVAYIRKHPNQFPNVVAEWKYEGLCSIEEYCDWMEEDGAWGDEHVIIALCAAHSCALHVLIHTPMNEVVTKKYGSVSTQHSKPYYITFSCRQEHYSAVIEDTVSKLKPERHTHRATQQSKRRTSHIDKLPALPRRSKRLRALKELCKTGL